jgi:hypothetical protein
MTPKLECKEAVGSHETRWKQDDAPVVAQEVWHPLHERHYWAAAAPEASSVDNIIPASNHRPNMHASEHVPGVAEPPNEQFLWSKHHDASKLATAQRPSSPAADAEQQQKKECLHPPKCVQVTDVGKCDSALTARTMQDFFTAEKARLQGDKESCLRLSACVSTWEAITSTLAIVSSLLNGQGQKWSKKFDQRGQRTSEFMNQAIQWHGMVVQTISADGEGDVGAMEELIKANVSLCRLHSEKAQSMRARARYQGTMGMVVQEQREAIGHGLQVRNCI